MLKDHNIIFDTFTPVIKSQEIPVSQNLQKCLSFEISEMYPTFG